jgi:hypothetical protein
MSTHYFKSLIKGLVVLPALLYNGALFSQAADEDDYVNDKVLKYDDYVYRQNIRTVQFHEKNWEIAAPVIDLHSNDQIELSFDDLDGDHRQFSFGIVHCNADWTPSDLMQSEYLNGFHDTYIQNFAYSLNTFQKYTHYSIIFPQPGQLQFTKSGNYLLYVYANGDKKDLVLSRRFMVVDNKVNVNANFRQPIGGGEQYQKQHMDFSINPGNYDLNNPYKDMKVVITQNNRWDNAVTDIKPTFINAGQLMYSLDNASTFSAGNEFRYFDMRSLRFLTERVKDIYRDKDMKMHVVLHNDELRRTKPYLYYSDFNGNFVIRNREALGSADTEADYVDVEFFLPYPVPEASGNFYVLGKLSDWRMNRRSRMTYDYTRLGYRANMYLKQGFYNYIYVLSNDIKKGGDETVTEGSHWDTENDYTIYVYHRKFGTYYDQLIGFKSLNSLRVK